MKLFLSILAGCMIMFGVLSASAQQIPGLTRAVTLLQSLREVSDKQPLSFDLKYVYSNEHSSDVLDSLVGNITMEGNKYRCLLDNTETICNGKYNIVLFKEDLVMHLSRGTEATSTQDPLQSIQTMLEKSGATGCTLNDDKQKKIINIDFAPGGDCKEIKMVIDTVLKRLLSVEYIVKTVRLTESSDTTGITQQGYEEFAKVRATFFNYHYLKPDLARFDEHAFFYKEGDTFKATPAYSSYKIFIATPNL
jgi:hypothetical protein